jgi:hypothetical protein
LIPVFVCDRKQFDVRAVLDPLNEAATFQGGLPDCGRWFDPRIGRWYDPTADQTVEGGAHRSFTSPFKGDAVLLLRL